MSVISITVAVILLLFLSAAFAVRFNRNIVECLHTAFFTVIVVLYAFYCLDLLRTGFAVAVTGIIAAILWTAQDAVKTVKAENTAGVETTAKAEVTAVVEKTAVAAKTAVKANTEKTVKVSKSENRSSFVQTVISNLLTPGLLIFLVVSVFCVIYTRHYKVILWDEERLWGAVPKALHETGKLQTGADALIFSEMRAYPPAMMLFGYFLTAFSEIFYENQLFAGYGIFTAAILIAGTRKLKWRQWFLIIPFGCAVLFAPCVITSNGGDFCTFYNSLFIDPVLGILIGFLFYQASEDPFRDSFNTLDFLLGLIVLTELKDSGIAFAVMILFLALMVYRTSMKDGMMTPVGYAPFTLRTVISTAVLSATWFSWKAVLKAGGSTSLVPVQLCHFTLDDYKNLGSYIVQKEIINVRGMFGYRFPDISFSLLTTFLICAGIGIIQHLLRKKRSLKLQLTVRAVMLISFVLFLYGYMCAFSDSVESHDKLPSFQRYMTALAGCTVTYELLGLFNLAAHTLNPAKSVPVKIAGLLAGVTLVAFMIPVMDCWSWNKYEDEELIRTAGETAELLKNKISEYEEHQYTVERPARVCNLMSGSVSENSMLHQRLYFELLGSEIQISNWYGETRIAHVNPEDVDLSDHSSIEECAGIWRGELRSNHIDYVYVMRADQWTGAIFNVLDIPLSSEENVVFRVYFDGNNKVSFRNIESE